MTYRDEFLSLALETDIITVEGGKVKIDPFFQGNAHAVSLAAKACREAMSNPQYLDIYNAGMLMAFDHPGYPLLPVAAQAFHGGDCKGFLYYSTYHLHKPSERHNGDQVVILGVMENEVELHGAIEFIGKYLGTCVGAVMLLSQEFSIQKNADLSIPVLRIFRAEEVLAQIKATTDREKYPLPG